MQGVLYLRCIGAVRDKQRSSKPCRHVHSWGVEGNSVWVADGCRAEFAVY